MKRLFIICIFFATQQILPITTRLSCLYNPQTEMKVAILYDMHDRIKQSEFDDVEKLKHEHFEITQLQKDELEALVNSASKDKVESVLFLVECHSLMRGEIRLGYFDDYLDILTVIPKIFLKRNVYKIGNAKFGCSDPRSHIDIFPVNFMSEFEPLKKQLKEGTLDAALAEITIGFYLDYIKKTYVAILEEIDTISFLTPESKGKVQHSVEQAYNKVVNFIDEAIEEYQLKRTDHMLDLYETQIKRGSDYLFVRIINWGCAYFDVRLLELIDYIAQHTDEQANKLVVQAGALHAKLLEHRLLQHGFELVSTYGNGDTYSVDENDYVNMKINKLSENWQFEKAITNSHQLIINFFNNEPEDNAGHRLADRNKTIVDHKIIERIKQKHNAHDPDLLLKEMVEDALNSCGIQRNIVILETSNSPLSITDVESVDNYLQEYIIISTKNFLLDIEADIYCQIGCLVYNNYVSDKEISDLKKIETTEKAIRFAYSKLIEQDKTYLLIEEIADYLCALEHSSRPLPRWATGYPSHLKRAQIGIKVLQDAGYNIADLIENLPDKTNEGIKKHFPEAVRKYFPELVQ